MTEAEYRGLVERVLSEGAYNRERGAYEYLVAEGKAKRELS